MVVSQHFPKSLVVETENQCKYYVKLTLPCTQNSENTFFQIIQGLDISMFIPDCTLVMSGKISSVNNTKISDPWNLSDIESNSYLNLSVV